MVLKTSDIKLPDNVEDIDDLNMHFEAQRKYNQKRDAEEVYEGLKELVKPSRLITMAIGLAIILFSMNYLGV